MGTVFVSYRRLGTHALAAAGLAGRLAQQFGRDQVFIDTQLTPGEHYPDELKAELAASDVVIAVIDESWVTTFDVDRRTDWVRYELSTALRDGKTVIPVLLEQARQPEHDHLPPDIAAVALLESARLRSAHYENDITALFAVLARTPAAPAPPLATANPAGDRRRAPQWLRVTIWAIVVSVLALQLMIDSGEPAWRMLLMAATAVLPPTMFLTVFVLVMVPLRPRLDRITRRLQERSLRGSLRNGWPFYTLYLLGLAIMWVRVFTSLWFDPAVKIMLGGATAVAIIRFSQLQIRKVIHPDTTWPPTITPDTVSFRRAARRFHELLTADPMTSRNHARQRQAESVLHALAEVRAVLADRADMTWRRWWASGQPDDPMAAVAAGAVTSIVSLACAGLVTWLWQGAPTPHKTLPLTAAILGLATVLAAVTLTVSFRGHRNHNRRLVAELREWDDLLQPLVHPRKADNVDHR